jgi:hypothetical protein
MVAWSLHWGPCEADYHGGRVCYFMVARKQKERGENGWAPIPL